MQYIKLQTFKLPSTSIQQKSSNSLANKVSSKRTQKVKITAIRFFSNKENQSLFCGLSDGTVMQFTQKKYSQKVKFYQQKEINLKQITLKTIIQFPNSHKGQIKTILFQTIFNQNFLITGSADRTIKIWDLQPKSKDIVQTLTGHSGTILAMIYSKKTDTIFTGSTDKSIRIWKQDQSRKFFLYPWYTCYQTITEFVSKKSQHPIYPTSFDLQDGQISNFTLYMGDSSGNLHIIKQIQLPNMNPYQQSFTKPRTAFQIDRSNYNYHRLAISSTIYVPKQHLVITASYDQYIYVFESLSDKLLLKIYNPRKVNYTSIIWYQNMLVATDQSGTIYCKQINSDKGVQQIKKYNSKILQINSMPGHSDLFILTEQGVDAVRLLKGIKAVEGDNCHTQTIVGMFSLQVNKLTENKIKDQAKIISVALDNTMRVWDPTDLSCLELMRNPQKCQISTLFYLKRANLFVTGHQNGTVRLWNIELQSSITISQNDRTHSHNNNICSFTEYIHQRSNQDVTQYMFSTGYEGKVSVWQIFIKKSTVQSTLMSSTICPQLKFSFYPNDHQQTSDQIGFQLFALQIWQSKKIKNSSSEDEGQSQIDILSAGTKGEVYFTRMFSYQTYRKIKIHDDSINSMMIDANILFTGGYDSTIKLTSLQTFQLLLCLSGHDQAIVHLSMIQQTGHLVSLSSDGSIYFWDYPQQKIVKKIKQKKQRITTYCYIDQLQMMYLGTQQAKILTHNIKMLYDNKVLKQLDIAAQQILKTTDYTEQQLKKILKDNQAQLARLMA